MEDLQHQIQQCTGQMEQVKMLLLQTPGDEGLLQMQSALGEALQLLEESLNSLVQPSGKAENGIDTEIPDSEGVLRNLGTEADDIQSLAHGGEGARWNAKKKQRLHSLGPGKEVWAPRFSEGVFHRAIIESVDTDNEIANVHWKYARRTQDVPCRFATSNRCRYGPANCQYSHGQPYKLRELRLAPLIREGDFATGDAVMVQSARSGVWEKATVDDLLDHTMLVTLIGSDVTEEVPFECAVPLEQTLLKMDESHSAEYSVLENVPEERNTYGANLDNLDTLEDGYVIGEWEKHTTGFASRMMAKMGYRRGEGLGAEKHGRSRPVDVVLKKRGVGLDYNSDDEARKKKKFGSKKKKAEKKPPKAVEQEKDVFQFINQVSGRRNLEREHVDGATANPETSDRSESDVAKAIVQARDRVEILQDRKRKLEKALERTRVRDPKFAQAVRSKLKAVEKEIGGHSQRAHFLQGRQKEVKALKTHSKHYF